MSKANVLDASKAAFDAASYINCGIDDSELTPQMFQSMTVAEIAEMDVNMSIAISHLQDAKRKIAGFVESNEILTSALSE